MATGKTDAAARLLIVRFTHTSNSLDLISLLNRPARGAHGNTFSSAHPAELELSPHCTWRVRVKALNNLPPLGNAGAHRRASQERPLAEPRSPSPSVSESAARTGLSKAAVTSRAIGSSDVSAPAGGCCPCSVSLPAAAHGAHNLPGFLFLVQEPGGG